VTPPPGYWISIVTKSRRLWWTETVIYMEPDIEFNQPRKHAEMIRVTLKDFFFFHTRAESRIPM
jgi:hypothetical protein